MWPGFRGMRHRGGLRYMVLYMLRETPMNGAEIMEKIDSMSMGWWRPSPGSLYPLLTSMSEEGLVVKREDGKYAVTQKGMDEIGGWWVPHDGKLSVEGAVEDLESNLRYLEDLQAEKLAPFRDRIKRIGEKTQKLVSRL